MISVLSDSWCRALSDPLECFDPVGRHLLIGYRLLYNLTLVFPPMK